MDGTGISECKVFEILSFVFDDFAVEIDACDAIDVGDDGSDVAVKDVFIVVVSELHDAVTVSESLETLIEWLSVWIEMGLEEVIDVFDAADVHAHGA